MALPTGNLRDFSQPMGKKPAPLNVLVVDDEPLIRWSLRETLGARGCTVVESGDAHAAAVAMGEAPVAFDIVLLDYRLPGADDLSMLTWIREHSPRTQVILMTAFGGPDLTHRALELGASRVVGKPFEMDEIADLVTETGLLKH